MIKFIKLAMKFMVNEEKELFSPLCYLFKISVVKKKKKKENTGVPVVAQWLTNPTRNHEISGSIPGLAQWVKDLALL